MYAKSYKHVSTADINMRLFNVDNYVFKQTCGKIILIKMVAVIYLGGLLGVNSDNINLVLLLTLFIYKYVCLTRPFTVNSDKWHFFIFYVCAQNGNLCGQ